MVARQSNNSPIISKTAKSAEVNVRANRLSYVGERGYELYLPRKHAVSLWQQLMGTGADLGVTPAGFHAMNACRMEKGYRHWGHDIYDHHPYSSRVGFRDRQRRATLSAKLRKKIRAAQ